MRLVGHQGRQCPAMALLDVVVGAKCPHRLQKPSDTSGKQRHHPDPDPSTAPWPPASPVQELGTDQPSSREKPWRNSFC